MILLLLLACSTPSAPPVEAAAPAAPAAPAALADALTVTATGEPGGYQVSVTVRSPDLGCTQYADWWEIVGEDGTLLYRRILNHSHPQEQPFTRDGGPVRITADERVWVRVHMHPGGYGGEALAGSIQSGFEVAVWPDGLGAGLEGAQPLPEKCLF